MGGSSVWISTAALVEKMLMTQPIFSKHWLTRPEYIRLERAAQARCAAVGDEHRLKLDRKELQKKKVGLSVSA